MRNSVAQCGTLSGYHKHLRLKESVCQPCRDARNTYRRDYYKQHPDIKRATDIRYLERHPGQRNKYDQKYRDNNREKTRLASLRWNKEHPDRMREVSRKRRASKVQNGHHPYTELEVLQIYGTVCYLCKDPINLQYERRIGKPGWEFGLHIDHVVPIISGGPDRLENVRPTHAICNLRKGSGMSFEPEIDEDLFDEEILAADAECDCGDDCICEEYEFDEDVEELEDLDEEWEEE